MRDIWKVDEEKILDSFSRVLESFRPKFILGCWESKIYFG
jgi:hypothetical protein